MKKLALENYRLELVALEKRAYAIKQLKPIGTFDPTYTVLQCMLGNTQAQIEDVNNRINNLKGKG